MIRLETLGSLDLRAADGTSMQPVLRQTKRLALLAYLAVEKSGQFQRRDHLLGLFWPETDLKGGRASLSQAVFYLRKHLGNDAILGRGDEELAINPERVGCDASDFQQHIAAGRFAEAMELYAGKLMPGIFVDEAEGFEQWVETKRDTLNRSAMRACVALAEAAMDRDDHSDVAHWLRRAISCFPYDESLHRRLISALDRAGDRAAALLAYEELERTLRTEFDSEPSAETRQLIMEVRSRSDAQTLPAPYVARVAALPRTGPASPSAPRRLPRRRYVGAVAAIVLLALAGMSWGAWSTRAPKADDALPINRLAILYFNDASPEQKLGYLADGLTTSLIDRLGNIRRIEVISENGVRPFRGDSIALDSIARQLQVGTIVGGTISQSGGMMRVHVEIVNGANGVALRTRKFERPAGELFALLDDVSDEVASFLRSSVGEEVKLQRYMRETNDVAAWQTMQKAQNAFAAADASVDVGDVRRAAESFTEAKRLLEQTIQLDAKWAAPQILTARIHQLGAFLSLITGDVAAQRQILDSAMVAVDEAVELDPANSAAWEERGRVQFTKWMMLAVSRADADTLLKRAEADLLKASTLDSDNARAASALSTLYETQGRFEAARRAALRALEADAYLEDAEQIVMRLFHASFEVDDDEQAGHWCDETRRRFSGRWPAAYCDLILLGWRHDGQADARKALYLLETFGPREHADLRALVRPRLMMLAAATVALSGDTARAGRMVSEARVAGARDPELPHYEAAYWYRLNHTSRAQDLLKAYLQTNPKAGPRFRNARMFRPLHEPVARTTADQ